MKNKCCKRDNSKEKQVLVVDENLKKETKQKALILIGIGGFLLLLSTILKVANQVSLTTFSTVFLSHELSENVTSAFSEHYNIWRKAYDSLDTSELYYEVIGFIFLVYGLIKYTLSYRISKAIQYIIKFLLIEIVLHFSFETFLHMRSAPALVFATVISAIIILVTFFKSEKREKIQKVEEIETNEKEEIDIAENAEENVKTIDEPEELEIVDAEEISENNMNKPEI